MNWSLEDIAFLQRLFEKFDVNNQVEPDKWTYDPNATWREDKTATPGITVRTSRPNDSEE